MQYRHAFHAGNFADVHKHIALLELVALLQQKAKGFLYLDTHAGEGMYDLAGRDARQSAESDSGITRLAAAADASGEPLPEAIHRYLEAVRGFRRAKGGASSRYPGSPLLVAAALREVDNAVCVESQAPASRALQRALEKAGLAHRVRVVHGDGYRELRSRLPPPTRRGLVFIDPPYETDEEQALAAALEQGLGRFETGVFAVWYPIKRRQDSDPWLARIVRGIGRPTLAAEFCLNQPDHAAGLNGSGLVVVNPPWQFDLRLAQWQPVLERLLGANGGSRVRWLVEERPGA
jgi:23S rRNA (adenine2030-N6)-methyltransferase